MKRPLTIMIIAILAVVVLIACASTIRTGKTSIVTITIGGTQGMAILKAEAATPWTKLKHYLADAKWMSVAYAYIPSVVQVLTVTVTAPDISTPIVGISSVSSAQTTATLKIEVPNGTDRHFLVEGLRALPSGATQTVYSGTNRTDLNGTDVNLQIFMNFIGTGIYVNPSQPLSANTPTCGTFATPCATITHVLTSRPATTDNDLVIAMAGNYIPGSVAAIETFPLQLKPGMALLCMGTNFSSVINVTTSSQTAIRGNTGASVDNCKIVAAPSVGIKSAVDDVGTTTKINGVYIELSGSPSVDQLIGARLSNDSLLLESTVTGVGASLSVYGVQVTAGKPNIIGNTISSLPYGIRLESGAGNAAIESNVIDSNQYGIWIASTSSPKISLNTIKFGSSTGIYVAGGTPEITSNDISNNSLGIDVEIGSGVPRIQGNSLSCNATADFFTNLSTSLDIRGNAWDNDLVTNPTSSYGPTEMTSFNGAFGCSGGIDICYQDTSPRPNFSSILPAVPNGCAVGVGKPAQ